MGSNRGKFDIIADMLLVARQGAKKTKIMYQANLSYRLFSKYLIKIRKAYLVRFERERRCYVLTAKGEEFLTKYKEYSNHNKHVEKKLNEVHGKRRILEELCSTSGVSVK